MKITLAFWWAELQLFLTSQNQSSSHVPHRTWKKLLVGPRRGREDCHVAMQAPRWPFAELQGPRKLLYYWEPWLGQPAVWSPAGYFPGPEARLGGEGVLLGTLKEPAQRLEVCGTDMLCLLKCAHFELPASGFTG